MSVLLENTPFVKFTRNYIRDPHSENSFHAKSLYLEALVSDHLS